MSYGGRPHPIVAAGTINVGGVGSNARLYTVTVNKGTASSLLKLYDGPAASGRLVATIDCATARDLNFGGSVFKDGIYAVMSAADSDVTLNAG